MTFSYRLYIKLDVVIAMYHPLVIGCSKQIRSTSSHYFRCTLDKLLYVVLFTQIQLFILSSCDTLKNVAIDRCLYGPGSQYQGYPSGLLLHRLHLMSPLQDVSDCVVNILASVLYSVRSIYTLSIFVCHFFSFFVLRASSWNLKYCNNQQGDVQLFGCAECRGVVISSWFY